MAVPSVYSTLCTSIEHKYGSIEALHEQNEQKC